MADEAVDYNAMTKADLLAEIDARNEDKADDAKLSRDGNKGDLIAALELDDEAYEQEGGADEGQDGSQSDEQDQDGSGEGDGDENPAEGDQGPEKTPYAAQQDNAHGPYYRDDEDGPVDYTEKSVPPNDGITLKFDEPERFEGEDDETGNFVIVSQNVYREYFPRNTRRPSYKMLYVKGQRVPKTAITHSQAKVETTSSAE